MEYLSLADVYLAESALMHLIAYKDKIRATLGRTVNPDVDIKKQALEKKLRLE